MHKAPSHFSQLGDFTTTRRVLVLAAMAVVAGSLGVGSAWVLLKLIEFVTGIAYYLEATTRHGIIISLSVLGYWSILVPVIGSLIVGFMARYGSDKIRGHGIPEALEAILIGQSRIGPVVTILKPLSSAIAIGTGGPFGAEGPIIMTGGALGSLFAQAFSLSGAERKTLLVAGAAAGMTAVFGTPIAAVLLSVELLLFEWKPRSFLPVLVACITASVERGFLLAPVPLFPHVSHFPITAVSLLLCVALGLICGLVSGILTGLCYAAEDGFALLPIHWMWWPALGGLVVGIGGLFNPSALGVGYVNIGHLLTGDTGFGWVLSLLLVKAIIWAVALGSGTSGGVLAPLLIMGGAVGALCSRFLPHVGPGDWALIAMAATMGGTMRAPLTSMMFAVELTGDGRMAIPLLTACGAAHAFTVLLLKRSILTEKLARRGQHLSREYSVDPLELTLVQDVMASPVETVPADMHMSELIHFFGSDKATHRTYPVVEPDGRVVGLASRADALAAIHTGPDQPDPTLRECLGGKPFPTAEPDEPVSMLVARMVQTDVGRIPVIRPDDGKLVGLVARSDLLRVRSRLLVEEEERQSYVGWHRRRRAA